MSTIIDRALTPPLEEGIQHEFIDYNKKQKRHGHNQDVKDENDIRQVAGCLPLDLPNRRVLLISSRKKKNAWVLPKGGWEQDETQQHAAQRETWEEAGVKGRITKQIGVFEERTKNKNKLKAHHWIYEMDIEEVVKKWPERKKRDRRWFTFQEALIATKKHRYIQEALMHSSLNPDNMPLSPRYSFEEEHNKDTTENEAHHSPDSKLSTTTEVDNSLMQAMKSIFI